MKTIFDVLDLLNNIEEFIMLYDGKYDTIGVIKRILMDEFKM